MYTTHRTVGSVIPVAVRHVSPKITFGGGGAHTNSMYGQFPFPFVICPMEFRNLLNSTLQISTTHPVSSNLTPSPLGSAWVRNHRGLKSAGLGQNSSVPLSEFSSRPFWDLHVIVRILSRPS